MKWRIAGILGLSLAAGCAQSGGELVWHKEGAGAGELEAAQYECERDTRMAAASFSGGLQGAGEAQAFATRCMNAKGFYPVSASTLGPVRPTTYSRGVAYDADERVLCRNRSGQSEEALAGSCVNSGGTVISRRS